MNYYNENDPHAAAWLRELIRARLIPDGRVDGRSIAEVNPQDLEGFCQCHFFAGIGGWAYALRLAGWPDDEPVWTGSCPCQPFSVAGKRSGTDDKRHLWPAFRRLISQRKPATVFGEQTSGKAGRVWLCGVRSDMEADCYAIGAANLLAGGVGAPHKRPRLYWVASYANGDKQHGRIGLEQMRRERYAQTAAPNLHREGNIWATEPKPVALVYGVSNRVAHLRGYGNAIVPQVAATFIQAAIAAMIQSENL